MRKIKDVLRLKFEAKLSHERIAAATGISKGAVSINRAADSEFGPSNADPIVDTVGGVPPRCVTVGKFEAPAEMVD